MRLILAATAATLLSACGQASVPASERAAVTAPDTVPFCLWLCARRPTVYVDILWDTVSALGDRDTTCAIVGGILAAHQPPPEAWLQSREPLPDPTALR